MDTSSSTIHIFHASQSISLEDAVVLNRKLFKGAVLVVIIVLATLTAALYLALQGENTNNQLYTVTNSPSTPSRPVTLSPTPAGESYWHLPEEDSYVVSAYEQWTASDGPSASPTFVSEFNLPADSPIMEIPADSIPSHEPTIMPTSQLPSTAPSITLSQPPSSGPTKLPSVSPSQSSRPSVGPSQPTSHPTQVPSSAPTPRPSSRSTLDPTVGPTAADPTVPTAPMTPIVTPITPPRF